MSFTVVTVIAISAGIGLLAYSLLWRRRQAQFIRQLLSNARPSRDRRVIASLSTLPDRIYNLEPTLRCLLKQTRPPDEIVLAVPEFSIRLQKEYVVPDYLEKIPHLRILRCKTDWGPATKFIPVVQEELAAGRGVSDIANELSLSVKTVSTYRSRILEKMSFSANADITSYALRNGLIQ